MKLAFWRKPDAPRSDRPDPDVQLRMAQASVERAKLVATSALQTAAESSRRAQENHISPALEAWFSSHRHSRRKMPPRKAS